MSSAQAVAALGAYFALLDVGARAWPADPADALAGPVPAVEPGRVNRAQLDALAPFAWAWLDPQLNTARAACQTNGGTQA